MNILLTGGVGYIGSHTAVAMLAAGHRVVLFDNFCNSSPNVITRLEVITGQHIPMIQGDVRDVEVLTKIIQDHKIEAVAHFAGLKAVGESVVKPIDYYDNNVCGTVSLLQAMQVNNVKTLVFSSSAAVYGEAEYLPYDEEHPTNAFNPYGRTKLYIEKILMDIVRSDPSWRIAVLRYFNPVGAHESGLIGEYPKGTPNNLMPYMTRVAAGQLPYLNIFGNDYPTVDGTAERDYIHVTDLAEGHLAALNFLNKEFGCHVFNLGTNIHTSVMDLVRCFEKVTGLKVPYQFVGRRKGDLASYCAKADKAEKLLKWKASMSLQQMCLSAWYWQKNIITL